MPLPLELVAITIDLFPFLLVVGGGGTVCSDSDALELKKPLNHVSRIDEMERWRKSAPSEDCGGG